MTRPLLASLALLIALALAACGGDDGGSGVEGSVSEDCDDYSRKRTSEAELSDDIIAGIVEVGFNPGPNSREAAAILRGLGTSYILPLPFRDMAVLCVGQGREEEWITRLRAEPWVEWAHGRGVNGFDTVDN